MTGWGQDGPLARARGTRHRLHRAVRRAACDRPRRIAARCRRSTSSATSAAAACCSAFGIVCALLEAQRSGPRPGRRRGDDRGRGPAHDDGVGHARGRSNGRTSAASTCSTPARRGTTPTRRATASTSRSARSSPSSTPSFSSGSGLPVKRCRRSTIAAAGPRCASASRQVFATKTRDEWSAIVRGFGRMRGAGADLRRSGGASACEGARRARHDRQRTAARARTAIVAHAGRGARPAAGARRSEVALRLADWGFDDARDRALARAGGSGFVR